MNKFVILIYCVFNSVISVLDALGKPPSGFLNGDTVLMGSYDTCKTMKGDYKPCKIKALMSFVSKLLLKVLIFHFHPIIEFDCL